MDRTMTGPCGRQRTIWGVFVLALGLGWALSAVGIVNADFWRYAGPLALVAGGATMSWPARPVID